jgi:dynein heavy chain
VAKAKPALLAAEKAVRELSKDDIAELKKVAQPTEAARLALACTLVLLGSKSTDWKTAQKALADMKFLDRLKSFDRDNIPEKVLEKVRTLTKSPEFAPERMLKASKAAAGLAKWCKAIRDYGESILVVRPLQEKQAQMRAELQDAQEAVAVKQQAVAAIRAKLDALEADYGSTLAQIQALKDGKIRCERRLANAGKLLSLLGSEGERWRAGVEEIQAEYTKVVGNVFMSVAQMSYLGPFTGQYREPALAEWM